MSKTFKIIGVILSLALIAGLGFCVVWTVTNFSKVQELLSGTNIYNSKDLDNAYKDGYETALDNEKEYTKLIENYKDTITELRDTVAQLNGQVTALTSSNTNLESTIQSLQTQRAALQTKVDELTATNGSNTTLIESLNTQINTLSQSIVTLTEQASNNATTISTLGAKITTLENTTAYYEELLMQYEAADKATVKFLVNNKVYNMQVVNKNSKVTVATPVLANLIFNGWTLDGTNIVDLSTITITENTTFIASITLQYDVVFKVDNVVYNTQKIATGDLATLPDAPTKENYIFVGWSLDGVSVTDITNKIVTANTTYFAIWTVVELKFSISSGVSFASGKTLFISNDVSKNILFDNGTYKEISSPITICSPFLLETGKILFAQNNYTSNKTYVVFNGEKFENSFTLPYFLYLSGALQLGNGTALIPTTTELSKNWVLWDGITFENISLPVAVASVVGNNSCNIKLENGKIFFSTVKSGLTTNLLLWNGESFEIINLPIGIDCLLSNSYDLGNGKVLFNTVTTGDLGKKMLLYNGTSFEEVNSPVNFYRSNGLNLGNGKILFRLSSSSLYSNNFVLWNGQAFEQINTPKSISFGGITSGNGQAIFKTNNDSALTSNVLLWNGNQFVEDDLPTAVEFYSIKVDKGLILLPTVSKSTIFNCQKFVLWNGNSYQEIISPKLIILQEYNRRYIQTFSNGTVLFTTNSDTSNKTVLLFNGTEFVEL